MEGDWLIARRQESGRGRQGRLWHSTIGNFFGSTIVDLRPTDPPASGLSMVAGLALIEAVDLLAPRGTTFLKWPNDLLLDGAKLAGILLERAGDRVVAGFGVNLHSAPDIPGRACADLGGTTTPDAFAPLLAGSFDRCLASWRSSEAGAFARAWLARAHPAGTRLTVHSGDGSVIDGTFDGIDLDGALRLRTEGGVETVRAGDVDLA